MAKLGKYSANGFKSCNLTLLLTYINGELKRRSDIQIIKS